VFDGIIYPSTRNPAGRSVALSLGRDDIEGLSRRANMLRFHPRLNQRLVVNAAKGIVQSWEKCP
jgi:hypothetical protein